jgi:hypothetical protein
VIQAEKAKETERKVKEFKARQMFKKAAPKKSTGAALVPQAKPESTGSYNSIFAPQNLEGQIDSNKVEPAEPQSGGSYNSIFAPQNLKKQSGSE